MGQICGCEAETSLKRERFVFALSGQGPVSCATWTRQDFRTAPYRTCRQPAGSEPETAQPERLDVKRGRLSARQEGMRRGRQLPRGWGRFGRWLLQEAFPSERMKRHIMPSHSPRRIGKRAVHTCKRRGKGLLRQSQTTHWGVQPSGCVHSRWPDPPELRSSARERERGSLSLSARHPSAR